MTLRLKNQRQFQDKKGYVKYLEDLIDSPNPLRERAVDKLADITHDLDKQRLPTRAGVYLINNHPLWEGDNIEIDVYRFKMKGLCCFSEDFGSSGTEGVNDSTDCHVSVQFTGLNFLRRIRGKKSTETT